MKKKDLSLVISSVNLKSTVNGSTFPAKEDGLLH